MKIPLFIVIIFSILAGFALLSPGLPPTHDGEYHVIRFYEFYKVLQNGEWYPRWAPDLNKGYGIPLFNYVYPLPNYVASFFHFLGVSFIDAFKLNMFLAVILGAVFMYLWAREFWGNWGGIVSSVFYTYSPYHFLDIYIRGSVGEVWALALFPAFLWSITKLIKGQQTLFLLISSIFLSLIIFSHNILALMFFPFAVAYIVLLLYQYKKIQLYAIAHTLLTIVFALGLSAIFWLPAIFERNFVRGLEVFDYRQHFVEVYQLIFPSWGSGFSADPTTQGMSLQIGIANLIVLVITIPLTIKKRIKINVLMLIFVFLGVFLMLKISQPIWKEIPFIQYFQFPWRLLSLVVLCISFLAGSVVYFRQSKIIFLVLLILPVILGLGYAKPSYYHLRDDNYYISRSNFIDGTNSIGNVFNTIWFNENLEKSSVKIQIEQKENYQIIKVNTAYFPGWQGFIDGSKVATGVGKDGLIEFNGPEGDHKIEVKFLDTPIRNQAKIILLLSLIILFLLFVKSLRVKIRE